MYYCAMPSEADGGRGAGHTAVDTAPANFSLDDAEMRAEARPSAAGAYLVEAGAVCDWRGTGRHGAGTGIQGADLSPLPGLKSIGLEVHTNLFDSIGIL